MHAGYLFKQSAWIKDWRRRYFRLFMSAAGPRLYFSADADAPPHGMVDLKGCLTVKSADEKSGKKFSFEVATGDAVFFLYAPTEAEKDEWVGQIGRAIVLGSRSFVAGAGDEEEEDDE